jgi:pyruvate,water dikinase
MILSADQAGDDGRSGGKAGALGRLVRAGYHVPPFVVVVEGDVPSQEELAAAAASIGAGPYAVRSSALQEDGSEHSHAGQYESLLNVPAAGLSEAVRQVLASAEREGLTAYRENRGLNGGDVSARPAVLIQRMVPAEKAGVAFSADPVSGRRDRLVVSAIDGLGDRLVAGEVDGASWWIARTGFEVVGQEGPEYLTAAELSDVAALAIAVEGDTGMPQDIEWAIADGQLYLLQARPITSPLRDAELPDDRMIVFDNSNIIESYPGIVSPLTFSFARYAYARVYTSFLALLGVDSQRLAQNRTVFDNMLARIDGRIFYNLGNWYRALALLPGYRLNAAHMETMMGVGEPLPEPLASEIGGRDTLSRGARVREYLRLAAVGWGLFREGMRLDRTGADFRRRLDRALGATTPERLGKLPPSALAQEYRTIEAELLDRWDAPIINDFLCMMAFGASRKLLERWCGPAGLEIHNDVLIGQGDIISAVPAQAIRAMGDRARGDAALLAALEINDGDRIATSAIAAELCAYIDRFGDRCTEELKLESVTLDEDPRPLHAAILAAAQSEPRLAVERTDPMAALADAMRGRPVRRWIARKLLNVTKRRVRDRENLRYERTRIFGRARRLFLAAGRQLHAQGHVDDPRDIFLLTVDEILGAIEGNAVTADLAGLANLRRAEMIRYAAMPDPPERLVLTGVPLGSRANTAAPMPSDAGMERQATACSAGCVTAIARVIRDPRTQKIGAGEILVARNTDPGWIALFASASAIVVERGSLLSHSAIVSRELGIPCVVGLRGACEWIEDGELVTVNGATGQVQRHGAGGAA